VIGEITTDKMVVVINKLDLLPDKDREARLEKVSILLTTVSVI
jgi:50S ribosomal subunit-associated GTPase HflX